VGAPRPEREPGGALSGAGGARGVSVLDGGSIRSRRRRRVVTRRVVELMRAAAATAISTMMSVNMARRAYRRRRVPPSRSETPDGGRSPVQADAATRSLITRDEPPGAIVTP